MGPIKAQVRPGYYILPSIRRRRTNKAQAPLFLTLKAKERNYIYNEISLCIRYYEGSIMKERKSDGSPDRGR